MSTSLSPPPSQLCFFPVSRFSSLFPCLRVSVAPLLALAPFLPHHLSPSRLPRFLPRPPTDTAPLTVKLYLNRQSIGFSDTDDMAPAQTLELTPEDLVAGSVSVLKFVKFQRVTGLSVRYVFGGKCGRTDTQVVVCAQGGVSFCREPAVFLCRARYFNKNVRLDLQARVMMDGSCLVSMSYLGEPSSSKCRPRIFQTLAAGVRYD